MLRGRQPIQGKTQPGSPGHVVAGARAPGPTCLPGARQHGAEGRVAADPTRCTGDTLEGAADEAAPALEALGELGGFRPPGVLAPPGARGALSSTPPSSPPAAAPEDVARIAEQLVQSMQVGGDRRRAGVRMRLTGRSGEPIEVQLVADADGVRATVAGEDDTATRSLAVAIEREMRSREVSLSELSVQAP